ncbi:WD repeat-containing protein [Xylariomycetidae sp. FL0641]|nr:WD repeat-containing protein [Xylariomycetidae sp. FL0641]
MASTPMDLDVPDSSSPANGTPSTSLNITRTLGSTMPATVAITDVIANFRPTKLFTREDIKEGRPQSYVLSLDYDDPGELLMTSASDETIQIYKVREGRHEKQLLSKKYGVKLAKFTRHSSAIIYASTKQNDAIRYLTTHDNAFIRYFEGHEAAVTCINMHPGSDDFISCGKDDTVRLWNTNTRNATGIMDLKNPYLSAFDPSGQVFAVGSPTAGSILLYDHRNFDKAPFEVFDVVKAGGLVDHECVMEGWTTLEFANDGRSVLLGTKGGGHFLLDSFSGALKAYLKKPENGRYSRLAAGEEPNEEDGRVHEGSGDCCFTADGRYVLGGSKKGVVVWDTLGHPNEQKVLEPVHRLEDSREAAVVSWNPRFNFLATADKDVVFWVPDPHA